MCYKKVEKVAAAEEETNDGNYLVISAVNDSYYLKLPGINIIDHFQVLYSFSAFSQGNSIMTVSCLAVLNPEYSGPGFYDTVSEKIAVTILKTLQNKKQCPSTN